MRVYGGRRVGKKYHAGVSVPGWSLLWVLLWVPFVVVWVALRILAGDAAPVWKVLAGVFLIFCIYEFGKWFLSVP